MLPKYMLAKTCNIKPATNIPHPIDTKLSRVSPTVMQATRSILIEADVPNPTLELQAGLFAEAEIVVNSSAQAIVVPLSAVSRFAGVQKVWIVEDAVARQQTIRTGREDENRVEVLEGLDEGATVVLNANEGHDGPVVPRERYTEVAPREEAPQTSSDVREESLNINSRGQT